MPGPKDGSYDFGEPFSPKDWAMWHQSSCDTHWALNDQKLGAIMKVGGAVASAAFLILIGLMGWSLKANYDNLDAQHQTAAALPATIAQTAQKASSETAQKLGATNAPSS